MVFPTPPCSRQCFARSDFLMNKRFWKSRHLPLLRMEQSMALRRRRHREQTAPIDPGSRRAHGQEIFLYRDPTSRPFTLRAARRPRSSRMENLVAVISHAHGGCLPAFTPPRAQERLPSLAPDRTQPRRVGVSPRSTARPLRLS